MKPQPHWHAAGAPLQDDSSSSLGMQRKGLTWQGLITAKERSPSKGPTNWAHPTSAQQLEAFSARFSDLQASDYDFQRQAVVNKAASSDRPSFLISTRYTNQEPAGEAEAIGSRWSTPAQPLLAPGLLQEALSIQPYSTRFSSQAEPDSAQTLRGRPSTFQMGATAVGISNRTEMRGKGLGKFQHSMPAGDPDADPVLQRLLGGPSRVFSDPRAKPTEPQTGPLVSEQRYTSHTVTALLDSPMSSSLAAADSKSGNRVSEGQLYNVTACPMPWGFLVCSF